MCILRKKQSYQSPNSVVAKLEQALKDTKSDERAFPTDEHRKEQTWRQIQLQLNSTQSGEKGTRQRRRMMRRAVMPVARTSVVIIVGLGVVVFAMINIFSGSGTKPTAAHSNTRIGVRNNSQPPVGETVTQLVPPAINPGNTLTAGMMSPVSVNGDWMITHTSNGTTQLQNVSGQVKIPISANITEIYGETPSGNLILGVNAGGAGATEVLNPVSGEVQKLPGKSDPAAHWAYQASESTTGHWAMTVANSMGAGPTQRRWVDVDGQKVASLQGTVQYAWSPGGNTLAAIVIQPSSGGVMTSSTPVKQRLVLYNASSGKAEFPNEAVSSTTFRKTEQFAGWGSGPLWSANGRYVLYQFWNNLYVFDTHTGAVAKLPIQSPSFIGFLPNDEVYVVAGSEEAVQLFTIQSGQVQLFGVWHAPKTINGVISTGQRLLIGIGGPSAGAAHDSGQVISLDGIHATTLVAKAADVWWYDRVDRKLYFDDEDIPGQAPTQVRSVGVPNVSNATGSSNKRASGRKSS